MKNLILKLYDQVGIKSDRTKNIVKHAGWSYLFKIGSVLSTFLIVPLTLNYLDTASYGLWLTLSSFVAWFGLFDIGLGNGLRNKLAEAKALGDHLSARAFVSTAYFTIGSISLFLVLLFLLVNSFINWGTFFGVKPELEKDLSILMPIVFAFFGLQMVAKLITSIFLADQKHSIEGKINFITQVITLIIIWLLTQLNQSSLLLFGSIFSALPVIILVGLNLFAFNTLYKGIKPKLSSWKMEYFKDITGLGFKFFVIQIAALVLFSTDNFLITKMFGPEEVVPYNIAYKYFSLVTIGYGIVIGPYWSTFSEAYAKKDLKWIKNSVSNVQRLWFIVPVVLGLMILISEPFYSFWVGESIIVPFSLSVAMAFFVLLITFNMIYVNFINGVGKIKLQLVTSLFSMIINIPLSIFLGQFLGWGSTGVILATCFSLGYAVIIRPVQYFKIINNKARGIWAQ